MYRWKLIWKSPKIFVTVTLSWSLTKGRFQTKLKLNGWMDLSIRAGWLESVGGQNPSKKLQRWSEWSNSSRKLKTLIFNYWGVRLEIRAVSQTFWLPLFPPKHFKRSRYQLFFKVLAKFGDYNDNKDIKKLCNFLICFIQRSAWLAGVRWALDKKNSYLLLLKCFWGKRGSQKVWRTAGIYSLTPPIMKN